MEPPRELDGAAVLHWAEITVGVLPTERTVHIVDGERFGPAAALAIARYAGDNGYYLFYLDESNEVVTDTLHESLDQAFAQAAVEYVGLDWREVSD